MALGLLHGPAELLPISSSGHIALVPWLAGWPYADLDPELRKTFEVALHAGTAAALLIALRGEVRGALADLDPRRVRIVVLSLLPPAAVAALLERADRAPRGRARRRSPPACSSARPRWWRWTGRRSVAVARRRATRTRCGSASPRPARSCPGVSRNGATLVAARARGFRREDANVLSRHVALPIIAAAAALKGGRLWRRGLPPRTGVAFAAGAAARFASTLGIHLADPPGRARPLAAALRGLPAPALAALVVRAAADRIGGDERRLRARPAWTPATPAAP